VGIDLSKVVYGDDPEVIDEIIDPESYYTSETKTGGTWINGKPIYRKVIQYNVSGSNWINIGTISNLRDLVKVYGSLKRSSGVWTDSPRATIQIYIDTSGGINWKDSEGNTGTVYQIFEYTKTTD
jgi:hypothetical protein